MIIKQAYAKVNLALDVLYKRDDGYHELSSIMHSIDLFDEVGIEPASCGINVICNEALPTDNTAYRAAKTYMSAIRAKDGLNIHIHKNIPSQAGLGGASADAAALLMALQEMYHSELSTEDLYRIGKAVGADVPFCLHGGCAQVGGIGEKLYSLPAQEMYLLLVQGNCGISTKQLFELHDEMLSLKVQNQRFYDAVQAAKACNLTDLTASMFNTLEYAAFSLLPDLNQTKRRLIEETDAMTALMTGSGSVIYGVYNSREKVEKAYATMSKYGYPFIHTAKTIQTQGIDKS